MRVAWRLPSRPRRRGPARESLARDVLAAAGLVGAILGGLLLYSGTWPPVVVIESGSMMHPYHEVPYGRLGTIDPGDIVLVRGVESREDVRTWVEGGGDRYGKPGDVIVYFPKNDTGKTPIIHRAMTWVEVRGEGAQRTYRMDWLNGERIVFGPEGIYFPPLGFDEGAGFSPRRGFQPPFSGFVTKGDNPATNARADQAGGLSGIVPPSWVAGKARGELPWFGLTKLLFADHVNQYNAQWIRIGNAYAPIDLWTMLGLCLALIALVPLGFDVSRAWREKRAAEADLRKGEPTATPDEDAVEDLAPPAWRRLGDRLKGSRKGAR